MEKANINGASLEYADEGSGEPVLLIGTGPIVDSFLPLFSQSPLVGRHRLITYRQRRLAHGGAVPAPVSFEQHAADAAAILAHLGVKRAHVAGHSTGAAIALQLALDCPDLVHTLALLEPPLVAAPGAEAFFQQAGAALDAYASGDHQRAVAAFLSLVCSLEWETCREVIERHLPDGVVEAFRSADNFFDGYLPALNAWEFGQQEAGRISQPLLSVLGSESHRWFVDGQELLCAWFPQIESYVVEGAAHLLHLQRPEPVAQSLALFFERNPIGDSRSGSKVGSSAIDA